MKITGTILSAPTDMDGYSTVFLLRKDEQEENQNLLFCICEGAEENRSRKKLYEGARIMAFGKLTIFISHGENGNKKISHIFNIERLC
jgi:exonuclease VII large subunit